MPTGYVEAFKKLGYDIHAPRSDVSAEKPGGIALAIMRHELDRKAMTFDSRLIEDWDKVRRHLPGNSRRSLHLQCCLEQHDGRVDVVLVDKKSKDQIDGAEPWIRSGSYWKVTYFDHLTGHHRVELKTE